MASAQRQRVCRLLGVIGLSACGARSSLDVVPRADGGIDAAPQHDAANAPIDAGLAIHTDANANGTDAHGVVTEETRIIASNSAGGYEVQTRDGGPRLVPRASDREYADIALGPGRHTLYAVAYDGLYRMDVATWDAAHVLDLPSLVALEIGADGVMYGAGGAL